MVLPTATPGISQKSMPCGPEGRHPHDPRPARGDRDPPVLVNNGLFQSLSSGRLIVFAFGNYVLGRRIHGSTITPAFYLFACSEENGYRHTESTHNMLHNVHQVLFFIFFISEYVFSL